MRRNAPYKGVLDFRSSALGETHEIAIGIGSYIAKLILGGFLLAVFETSIAKMRVFRVPAFLGAALMLGLLGTLLLFVSGSL